MQVCRFGALGMALPDMLFPQNRLLLRHGSASISFDAHGALTAATAYTTDARVQVSSAVEWQQARP
jgi:hypothetical protein